MKTLDFVTVLPSLKTVSAVSHEIVQRASGFGFGSFAIGGIPSPDYPVTTPFMVHNWPPEWQQIYTERNFGPHDPALRVVQTSALPMSVRDIRKGLAGFKPSREALAVLDAAADLGRPEGLIVPIFGPNAYRAIACFAGIGPDPSAEARACLHLLAIHAHNRLRDLHSTAQPEPGPQALTTRELAILQHAQHGQSDADIAATLGITVRTVRFHFENARHKLGARTRSEAIASAVHRHMLAV